MDIPEPTSFILAVMGATLFGLISLPHCFGMCGPLHLSVCLSGGKSAFRVLSFFNIGRIATYTVIGLCCGLLGAQVARLSTPESKAGAAPPVTHEDATDVAALESEKAEGEGGAVAVPKSCCEVSALADTGDADGAAAAAAEKSSGAGALAPMEHAGSQTTTLKTILRRALMFIFPACILLLTGLKALWKPVSGGEGDSGWFAGLFKKFSKGGPMACGVAAGLLPCGMLYYAFAVAFSTLSPLLGATFLCVYCLTISFFMELSLLVGATSFRHLGPKINRLFPYMALTGAGVYVTLFFLY